MAIAHPGRRKASGDAEQVARVRRGGGIRGDRSGRGRGIRRTVPVSRPRSALVGSAALSSALAPVASAVAGYLLGTIPSADAAARLATGGATDLRTRGSGNPGAVNAMEVLGKGWGYGIMAADILKGAVACAVGRRLAGGHRRPRGRDRGRRRPLLPGLEAVPGGQGRGREPGPVRGHLPRLRAGRPGRGVGRRQVVGTGPARHRGGVGHVGGGGNVVDMAPVAQPLGTAPHAGPAPGVGA